MDSPYDRQEVNLGRKNARPACPKDDLENKFSSTPVKVFNFCPDHALKKERTFVMNMKTYECLRAVDKVHKDKLIKSVNFLTFTDVLKQTL